MTADFDANVRRLAGSLREMLDENSEPYPGSVLSTVLSGDEEAGARALHDHAVKLLGVDGDEADRVIDKMAEVVEMTADTQEDIDSLPE